MADSKLQILISAKDNASSTLSSLSRDLKTMGDRLTGLGTGMTVGITAPILAIGGAISKIAMDAVESENLFEVSMKGMAGAAREWSETTSKALGINAYALRRNVGVFNSMFTSMGLSARASLDMSEGLTQLSYDAASFFNLRPDEAFGKIRAAIVGETEPLRQLGVIINETNTKQWAFDNGLIRQGEELSEAQKVLARYGLIMQQTSNVQGDMARTIDSPTNAIRRFKDQLEELATNAGQTFLPDIQSAFGYLNNEAIPRAQAGLQEFKAAWAGLSDEGRQQILSIAVLLVAGGPLFVGLGMAYKGVVALIGAFKALRLGAVAELAAVSLAAFQVGYALQKLGKGQAPDLGEGFQAWQQWVGGMMDGAVKAVGGVLDFDEALNMAGVTGIDAFDGIRKAMDRTVVSMPSSDDLTAAWTTGKGATMQGPPTQQELIKNYEQLNNVIVRNGAVLQAQTPALKTAQDEWGKLGGASKDAAKGVADSARSMVSSTSQIVDALVRMHPASQAAAARVASLKVAIAGVQAAIAANNDAIHNAQAVLSGLQERVSQLSEALSGAKSRLEELANVRLPGMNAMDEQLFQIEQQIKRVKLAEMGLDASGFSPLTAEAAAFVATLPKSTAELEKMLEAMRLQKSLRYDEQLRKIQEAARGVPREMAFSDAISQIASTKNEIFGLEGALAGAQQAVKAQQASIAGLQEASYQLGKQLGILQDELSGAEETQQAVNDVLKAAVEWQIEHKDKLIELGGEYAIQAGLIDVMTRQLVADMTRFVLEETDKASAAIRAMFQQYEDARAMMAAGGSSGGSSGGGVPGYAGGTSYHPGGLAIVGENGPELLSLPRGSAVTPMRALSSGSGMAAPIYNVTVNVGGSVVTEKELVDTVRRELIKTGKRNVSALGGF